MAKNDWRDETVGSLVSLFPLGGLFEPAAKKLSSAFRAEVARNCSRAIRAAERVSGMSREQLGESISANPALVSLTVRTLHAAGMAGHDELLDALGAALGEAVAAPSRVEESDLLLLGLQQLRPAHIRVLRELTGTPCWLGMPGDQLEVSTASKSDLIAATEWRSDAVAIHCDIAHAHAALLLTGLVNSGFVSTTGVYNTIGYLINDFGVTLLDVLSELPERGVDD